jgi:superfamily II DNA or RNA helicase/HKD family nuclease/diadenosine tetraphosphate (Ap4A) HIT family hydrolase
MSDLCPFCNPDPSQLAFERPSFFGLWDGFPVSPGHMLVIPRCHLATWFDATTEEQMALLDGIEQARQEILRRYKPDGFNIGINISPAAGQTVFHLHLHVIPRYNGDVPDPRGGVRNIIPGRGNYLRRQSGRADLLGVVPHQESLIHGGADDPLLPHFLAYLNRAIAADFCVAFARMSGLVLIQEHLRDLLDRGGRVRFLTGDYLDITEPEALANLLDLNGSIDLRIFESRQVSFHPKGYIFYFPDGTATAIIGSSNLSASALQKGIEWNCKLVNTSDPKGMAVIQEAFDRLFTDSSVQVVNHSWVQLYRERRCPPAQSNSSIIAESFDKIPEPHSIQLEALNALALTRREGNAAGLVVLATGLGKTWLSAFDSYRPEFKRILFVAHREEILSQALKTFRRIRPDSILGRYTGTERAPDAEILFASVQTLGRQIHLQSFSKEAFDYIVIDEFHHAAAATYRRIIDYFSPKFLLGLTATPERTDGGDLLGLCEQNLVYKCDLKRGISEGLLSPFHYFGVPDDVDYRNIPWRNNRFDDEELTRAVATEKRAKNALEQLKSRGGVRTLAFCCSQRHCDFMAEFFSRNGLRAVAVHSGEHSAPRAASLEALEAGGLDIVCAVDMFNEGVDIPNVDTVMMLRPTESTILWLQQFGRGLRRAEKKSHLRVIDYVGNHRSFLNKPRTLLDLAAGDRSIDDALNLLIAGQFSLPPGCAVTYELQAIDILRSLLRQNAGGDALQTYYVDFRERHGRRPTAIEVFYEGFTPRAVRQTHGSWLHFVKAMGDLDSFGAEISSLAAEFLTEMEVTRTTKSFKMLTILAMLDEDALPGGISTDALTAAFARRVERSSKLKNDVGVSFRSRFELAKLLEQDSIADWTGSRKTERRNYFTQVEGEFTTRFDIPAQFRPVFQELVRELADWRLAEYLSRGVDCAENDGTFTCKISNLVGSPILSLPDRSHHPQIPIGWVDVEVDGRMFQINIATVTINEAFQLGNANNQLGAILIGWFGPDVGRPGTNSKVLFEPSETGYRMRPAISQNEDLVSGSELWTRYLREQIPPLFGLNFSRAVWHAGFVATAKQIILLVTLEKEDMPDNHQYEDKFLSPTKFQWCSQNRTTQASKHGKMIKFHVEKDIKVHLFVRSKKKILSRSAPFYYCGEVTFERWSGERPITVYWTLPTPVPEKLHRLLSVPSDTEV